MAQTGFTPLQLYYSATTTNVPSAANLLAGELALNITDGVLFYKDSSNVVQVIGTKGGVGSSSNTQVLYNNAGLVVGSSNMTFNGTTLTSSFSGAHNGTVGATTPSTGKFTTLTATASVTTPILTSPAATALTIQSAGTTALTVDTSQNVGIGLTSPTAKLQVAGTASGANIRSRVDNLATGANTTADFIINTGAANSYTQLQTVIGGGGTLNFGPDLTSGTVAVLGAYPLIFNTNNTERMRLDANGNLLVGATTSGIGTTRFGSYNNNSTGFAGVFANQVGSPAATTVLKVYHAAASGATSANQIEFLNGSASTVGSVTSNGSATLYNTTSDYRLKTVISAVSGSGKRIDALEPIEYKWKVDGSRTRGFLAHKFQEVYAGSVNGTKDAVDADGNPVYQSMQAGSAEVIADLVTEIQSLRKRLAAAGI